MNNEEVIFEGYDAGWSRILPVKLLTYEDGSMDIHRQTGSQFDEHIGMATEILEERGLLVDETDPWMFGSTGAYRRVLKA